MGAEVGLLLVSADPLARAALGGLLASSTECVLVDVISPVLLERELLNHHESQGADVIIWDLGLETADLPEHYFRDLELPIVAIVAEEDRAKEVLAAGALGIVPRDLAVNTIIGAAEAVHRGLIAIDPVFLPVLALGGSGQKDELVESLTPRELEVLQLLAEGLTNRAIANRLDVTEHTIKFHVNSILSKLDAQSRTEAVVTGTRLGLIAL